MTRVWLLVLTGLTVWTTLAEEPAVHSLALNYGFSVGSREDHFDWLLVSYDRSFGNEAELLSSWPDPLRLKLEVAAGTRLTNQERFVGQGSVLLQCYIDALACSFARPYIEGGVGGICTDFLPQGQGTRWNFLEQIGFGFDLGDGEGPRWFVSVRYQHASNAGLNSANRGLDLVYVSVGRYF
jgi:hypothetical protein